MRKLRFHSDVDTSILTEAEIAAVQKEAVKQVEQDRKKLVIKAYHDQMVREERAKVDENETLEDVIIDLPGYTKYLLINGMYYDHGTIASVPHHVAVSLREIMGQAWQHERISGNPNMKDYKSVSNGNFYGNLGSGVGFTRA